MKFGFSIYSLWNDMRKGAMTPEEAFAWMHDNGCDHVEMADFVIDLHQPGMPEKIAELSAAYDLPVSAYSVGSRLAQAQPEEYEAELKRLQGEIEIAHRMGASLIRCDLVRVMIGKGSTGVEEYDRLFPQMVRGAQDLADYAAQYGMQVTVENHGTLLNGGERVRRLLQAVNRPNYGCTLDIGNAVCVDEDPLICTEELLPFAKRIHIKDFYIREDAYAIGAKYIDGYSINDPSVLGNGSWLTTRYKRYLRGAIVGHGDLPMRKIIEKIVQSGYDGHLTIEFEGMEDCRLACQLSLQNLKQLTGMAR